MHFCSSFTPKFLLKLCGAASSQAQNGAVRELPPECYLCPSRLTKISNNLIVNIQQWAKRYFTEAKTHTGILVSAGTELVFFLVAGTGLRFGFENENNVDNTLKFQLLLSCAHPKSDFSVSHALPVRRCTRNLEGAQPGQGTWSEQRDTPYCDGQNINWGGLLEQRADHCSGMSWSAGDEQLYCASLVSLGCDLFLFIISLFITIVIIIIIIIFSFISVISTHGFTFSPLDSPPRPTGAGAEPQPWVMQLWVSNCSSLEQLK